MLASFVFSQIVAVQSVLSVESNEYGKSSDLLQSSARFISFHLAAVDRPVTSSVFPNEWGCSAKEGAWVSRYRYTYVST